MSSPKTDIEKQSRRHFPSLLAISLAGIAALIVLAAVAFWAGVPRSEQAAPAASTATE